MKKKTEVLINPNFKFKDGGWFEKMTVSIQEDDGFVELPIRGDRKKTKFSSVRVSKEDLFALVGGLMQ